MNILIVIGIVLGGGVIATDHLVGPLPNWLAIVLYTSAVVLVIAGMVVSRSREAS